MTSQRLASCCPSHQGVMVGGSHAAAWEQEEEEGAHYLSPRTCWLSTRELVPALVGFNGNCAYKCIGMDAQQKTLILLHRMWCRLVDRVGLKASHWPLAVTQ
jgi:hypothetical protein